MGRRLLVIAGWLGAAVLAVLAGLAAVDVIGEGLTSPETRPLSADDVTRALEQLPPSAEPGPSSPRPHRSGVAVVPRPAGPTGAAPATTSPPTAAAPTATQGVGRPAASSFRTRGGTVVARCDGTRPVIVTMSPAQGFSTHEQNGAEGEFRSTSDNHDRVKIDVSCPGGTVRVDTRDEDDD